MHMNVHTKQANKSDGLVDEVLLSQERELRHLKTTAMSLSLSTIHTSTLLGLDLEWISRNIDNFGTSVLTLPPGVRSLGKVPELDLQKWQDNFEAELEAYISAKLTQLGNHCGILLSILKNLHYKEGTENHSESLEELN